jgi:hypothetical protein
MRTKLRTLASKSKRLGKNTPEYGLQCNGYTRNRDRRYDGGVRSVELSSPPAKNVVHVSTRYAQAVNATRELYIGYFLWAHRVCGLTSPSGPEGIRTEIALKMFLVAEGRPGLTAHLHGVCLLPSSRIISKCGMMARDDVELIVLRIKERTFYSS